MPDLFRAEAIAHSTRRLPGEISLAMPFSTKLLAGLFISLVAGALLFFSSIKYAQHETVTGWLTPEHGLLRIAPPREAVVEAVHVKEGDRVSANTPIATLKLSTDLPGGDASKTIAQQIELEAQASAAHSQAARGELTQRQDELRDRSSNLRHQLSDASARAAALMAREELARRSVARAEGLSTEGFVSAAYLDGLRSTALVARSERHSAEGDVRALERQLVDLEHEAAVVPKQLQELEAEAAQNRAVFIQRRLSTQALGGMVARAPVGGRVLALPISPGQLIDAGNAVAIMTADGEGLIAELYVPSRAAGFIRAGQEVRLMYQPFPYETYGVGRGVVRQVSRTVLAPRDVAVPGLSFAEPVFRVQVAGMRQSVSAYGREVPLQPGMLVEAQIVISRRTLLQTLLAPLYAAGRRT